MRVALLTDDAPAGLAGGLTRALGDAAFDWQAGQGMPDVLVLAGDGDRLVGAARAFADAGRPVLGVGPGARLLCAAGLLPGAVDVAPGRSLSGASVHVRVEGRPTPFTAGLPAGRVLALTAAHAEGAYEHEAPGGLTARGQVVLRYCDAAAGTPAGANPNGAAGYIAGVCAENGRVVGLFVWPGGEGEAWWRQVLGTLRLPWR